MILELKKHSKQHLGLPDQIQREKCKAGLSPMNCKIERGGKAQHIMHNSQGHTQKLEIHS